MFLQLHLHFSKYSQVFNYCLGDTKSNNSCTYLVILFFCPALSSGNVVIAIEININGAECFTLPFQIKSPLILVLKKFKSSIPNLTSFCFPTSVSMAFSAGRRQRASTVKKRQTSLCSTFLATPTACRVLLC